MGTETASSLIPPDLDAHIRGQTSPPILLKPISARELVVVTQDENKGAQIDFIEGDGGAIRFLRMDGRLYDRVAEESRR